MKKKTEPLRYRQVHLDFHTAPAIADVGAEFDAKEFASTFKRAHVNSVTVFAKCHHGHLYYKTKRCERHPGLAPGLNLLGQQVDALHREGIRAPIYISVQCDEYAANTYPQWVARRADGSQVKSTDGEQPAVFRPGWQILDMSSPYQDFLAEQTSEVLKLFKPVDGIFFDMCWDQPSTSKYALDGMRQQGLNPELDEHRDRYANMISRRYMKRFYDQVKASAPQASVFFNCRPFAKFAEEFQYQTQAEIEALPTGGWGYMYFPISVRSARTLPRPYMGMTARFHKSWADFGGLKPRAALEFETSQMMAHGARCSIGDQLHPRGKPDRAAYQLIEQAYARVEAAEPWLANATPVTQIGLFQIDQGKSLSTQNTNRTDEGAVRMLTQLKHQFDVVQFASDLGKYELLILPDAVDVRPALAKKLRSYLNAGGKILVTGISGLAPDGLSATLQDLPIMPHGWSPYSAVYLRFGSEIGRSVPNCDHICYERTVRVTLVDGASSLSQVVEPYFERTWDHFCSHRQTPPNRVSRFVAAAEKRNVGYIAFPIFTAFATHGNLPYRLMARNMIDRLLPEPLIAVEGPSYLEATVMRQAAHRRTIVHLLAYSAERRTPTLDIVEDVVPLYDIQVSLRMKRPPRRVYLAPSDKAIRFEFKGGRIDFVVPELRGHQMIGIE